jgi:hypothetical protein
VDIALNQQRWDEAYALIEPLLDLNQWKLEVWGKKEKTKRAHNQRHFALIWLRPDLPSLQLDQYDYLFK